MYELYVNMSPINEGYDAKVHIDGSFLLFDFNAKASYLTHLEDHLTRPERWEFVGYVMCKPPQIESQFTSHREVLKDIFLEIKKKFPELLI